MAARVRLGAARTRRAALRPLAAFLLLALAPPAVGSGLYGADECGPKASGDYCGRSYLATETGAGYVTSAASSIVGTDFSVSFWTKRLDSSTEDFVLTHGTSPGDVLRGSLKIGFGVGDEFRVELGGGDDHVIATGNTVGVWAHWAVLYRLDGDWVRVYRDGALLHDAQSAGTYGGGGGDHFGLFAAWRDDSGNDANYNGLADELVVWKRRISVDEILSQYSADRYDLRDAVMYFPFDEEDAGAVPVDALGLVAVTVLHAGDSDYSWEAPTAALELGLCTCASAGLCSSYTHSTSTSGGYLVPDGTGTVTLPDLGSGGYTVGAWVFFTDMTRQNIILHVGDATGRDSISLFYNPGGKIRCGHWADDLDTAGSYSSHANSWHHIACAYDGFTRRIYVDGVSVAFDTPAGALTLSGEKTVAVGNIVSPSLSWSYRLLGAIDYVYLSLGAADTDSVWRWADWGVTPGTPVFELHMESPDGATTYDQATGRVWTVVSDVSFTNSEGGGYGGADPAPWPICAESTSLVGAKTTVSGVSLSLAAYNGFTLQWTGTASTRLARVSAYEIEHSKAPDFGLVLSSQTRTVRSYFSSDSFSSFSVFGMAADESAYVRVRAVLNEGSVSATQEYVSTAVCAAGHAGSTSCDACAAGEFASFRDVRSACDPCPAGSISSAGATYCSSCPYGYYADSGGSACTPCAAGRYLNASGDGCDDCPANTYSETVAAGDASTCQACPPGGYALVTGATSCAVCGAGEFLNDTGDGCDGCPLGTARNATGGVGSASCETCPRGTVANTNSSATYCEPCPLGTLGLGVGVADPDYCVVCGAGRASGPATGSTECAECEAGRFSAVEGMSECEACPTDDCEPSVLFVITDSNATKGGGAFVESRTSWDELPWPTYFFLEGPPVSVDLHPDTAFSGIYIGEPGVFSGDRWELYEMLDNFTTDDPEAGIAPVPEMEHENGSLTLTHEFTEAGRYVALRRRLSVQTPYEPQSYAMVFVSAPPVAAGSVSPPGGTAPLVVEVSGAESTDDLVVDHYLFVFGDGTDEVNSTLPRVYHTYETPGTYTVSVTAVDGGGLLDVAAIGVVVVNAPPVAALEAVVDGDGATPADSVAGVAPLAVTLNAGGSADPDGVGEAPLAYAFDFGDASAPSTSTTAMVAAHTYAVPGVYAASVTVTDSAGAESSAFVSVFVIDPSSVAPTEPAPALVSAQFSGSGASALLTFDGDTDRGAAALGEVLAALLPHVPCAAVLDDATAAAVGGDEAWCRWLSAATLRVQIGGSAATVRPGDKVATRAAALLSADGLSFPSARMAAVAAAPDPLPAVVPVLAAPAEVGMCSGAALSAEGSTGSAGRPLTFAWRVANAAGDGGLGIDELAALAAVLAAAGPSEARLELDAALLPVGSETVFEVTAYSWLGASATATRTVRKRDVQVPAVQVPGPAVRAQRATASFVLSAEAALATCGNDSVADAFVRYAWTQLGGVGGADVPDDAAEALGDGFAPDAGAAAVLPSGGRTGRVLTLAPGTLEPGAGYAFQVTATLHTGAGAEAAGSSAAYVGVEVLRSALVARIAGGDRLVTVGDAMPEGESLTLDGSGSTDPDGADGTLSYSWSCARAFSGGDCFSAEDTSALFGGGGGGASVEVPLALLSATDDGDGYVFSLVVSKDTRTSEAASVSVSATEAVVPAVSVARAPVGSAPSKHNPRLKLVLRGEVESPPDGSSFDAYDLLWSCTSGNLDLNDSAVLGSSSTAARDLVVRAGALAGGATYSFRLTATDPVTGAAGRASATVLVNAAPTSGECGADPESGSTLSTEFRLWCSGWADDPDDGPFEYSFALATPDGGERLLRAFAPGSEMVTASLPQGAAASDHNHTVTATVRDSYGAAATFSFRVQVLPPALGDGQTAGSLAADVAGGTAASEAAASGDAEGFAQVLYSVTSLLDDAGDAGDASTRQAARTSLMDGVATLSNASAEYGDGGGFETADALLQRAHMIESVSDGADASEVTQATRRQSVTLAAAALGGVQPDASADDTTLVAASVFVTVSRAGAALDSGDSDAAGAQAEVSDAAALVGAALASTLTPGEQAGVLDAGTARVEALSLYGTDFGGVRLGDADAGLGSVVLPDSFAPDAGAGADDAVSGTVIMSEDNVYAWADGEGAPPARSPIVSVLFARADGGNVTLGELDAPLRVELPVLGEPLGENEVGLCRWWDEAALNWSTVGCERDADASTSTLTVCLCTQLGSGGSSAAAAAAASDRPRRRSALAALSSSGAEAAAGAAFSAVATEFVPSFEAFDAADVSNVTWENLKAHPWTMIGCAAMVLLYLALLPVAVRHDHVVYARSRAVATLLLDGGHAAVKQVSDHLWERYLRARGDAAAAATAESEVRAARLAERARRVEMSSPGADTMLHADAIVVVSERERLEHVEGMIGALPLSHDEMDGSKMDRFRIRLVQSLKEDHLWLSIAKRRASDPFTSVQRLTVVLAVVIGTLTVNSFFFGQGQRMGAVLVVSFISGLAVVPVAVFMAVIFQRIGPDMELPLRQVRALLRARIAEFEASHGKAPEKGWRRDHHRHRHHSRHHHHRRGSAHPKDGGVEMSAVTKGPVSPRLPVRGAHGDQIMDEPQMGSPTHAGHKTKRSRRSPHHIPRRISGVGAGGDAGDGAGGDSGRRAGAGLRVHVDGGAGDQAAPGSPASLASPVSPGSPGTPGTPGTPSRRRLRRLSARYRDSSANEPPSPRFVPPRTSPGGFARVAGDAPPDPKASGDDDLEHKEAEARAKRLSDVAAKEEAAALSAESKPRGKCDRFRAWRDGVRLPSWFIYVAYTGVVIYLAGCIFICLVMGLKFDLDEDSTADSSSGVGRSNRAPTGIFSSFSTSGAWVLSSALSIVQDIAFNQPLRAVIQSALAEIVGSEHLADLLAI